tara:strand:- start:1108 stop:1332 length:225 start_codon:yes stop_codon:yes gene_type:complete
MGYSLPPLEKPITTVEELIDLQLQYRRQLGKKIYADILKDPTKLNNLEDFRQVVESALAKRFGYFFKDFPKENK